MKREFLAVVVAVGLAGIVQAQEAAAPKIELDRIVYDFGKTSAVTELTGVFIISNTGKAPLTLQKPSTSCGCTLAALKVDTLAPGEKTELSFKMDVSRYVHGGHAEKQINVPSNDPEKPNTVLTVKGDIVFAFEFTPQIVTANNLRLGSQTNVVVRLQRVNGQPLGITRAEVGGVNPEAVQAKLEAVEGKPDEGRLVIDINGQGGARVLANSISLFDAAGKAPLFIIPVNGRVVGDVTLRPEMLQWGVVDPTNWPGPWGSNLTTRVVSITSELMDESLTITGATCSIPEVRVSISPVAEGKTFKLVAVLDKAPSQSTRGRITFQTNAKLQPTVEIPVSINVFPRQ